MGHSIMGLSDGQAGIILCPIWNTLTLNVCGNLNEVQLVVIVGKGRGRVGRTGGSVHGLPA